MPPEPSNHWTRHALAWRHFGPPLRPAPEDVEHLRGEIAARFAGREAPIRGLLLGVTPEIAGAAWKPPVDLLAVDESPAMIAHVWPGDGPSRRAVQGDWRALPVADASIDVAFGDGCFSVFSYPREYRSVAAELARVLPPGGLLLLRIYARPSRPEPTAAIWDDLFARRIGSFHAFKWRLAMALHGDDAEAGVHLADIYRAYRERAPDPELLAAQTGFPIDEVRTMDGYAGAARRYSFPTAGEVASALAPSLALVASRSLGYELGDRCPHLVFERR